MLRALVGVVIIAVCASGLSFHAAAFQPWVRSARTSPFTIEGLLVKGDLIEGAPYPFNYGWFGSFGLNDNGELAVVGYLGTFETGTASGMFVARTGEASALILRPYSSGGLSNAFPAINSGGEAAALIQREPSVSSPLVLALFSEGEQRELLALTQVLDNGRTVAGFNSYPVINDAGEVVISAVSTDGQREYVDYFILRASGEMRLIGDGTEAPGGGVFSAIPGFLPPPAINNRGDVLFLHGVSGGIYSGRDGLFLARETGIEKVVVNGDELEPGFVEGGAHGSLNNLGQVAIVSGESVPPYRLGIFVWSNGTFTKIISVGERSPDGGVIASVAYGGEEGFYAQVPVARINDSGTVVFNAKIEGPDGNLRRALFLGSPRGMLRIAQQGDRLPTGDRLYRITHYALNNLGQVAFYAYKDQPLGSIEPIGVFLATPAAPAIRSVKLKSSDSGLTLRIKGDAMVAGDAIIEIDGVALEALEYPAKSRNDDGTARIATSADPRLGDLLPVGTPVSVTVFNPLTGKRSEPFSFVRN
jgi:hypothetical protein